MENKIDEINDIRPYIDAFSFFINYEPMKVKLKNIFSSFQDGTDMINDYLLNYIQTMKNNCLINKTRDTEEIKKQKLIFQKKPQKAFDFLLDELHKLDLGKEVLINKSKSAETNKENALKYFQNFMAQDKSCISVNFYGIKLFEKKCQVCKMTNHVCKYLKTIPIKINEINEENEIDFEKCIKRIQAKFSSNGFCPFCSKKQNLEIKIRIKTFPKILIFVLYGNDKFVQFKIKNSIRHGEYELIAAEIKYKKNLFDLFDLFCVKRNNFKFICNEPIGDDVFKDNIPIVLFYKKRGQMIKDKETGADSTDSICSSISAAYDNKIFDKDDIKIQKLLRKKNDLPKIIEKKNLDGKANIIIYFKFKKSEKELYYIETNTCETFKNIINSLKEKYELKSFDYNRIFFNDGKINMDKTPKDYNMNGTIHLTILEE